MEINITKGEECKYFSRRIIDMLYGKVAENVSDYISNNTDLKPSAVGAFALHDVPLLDASVANVWIEFNANILPGGLVDAGIHRCIIYDKIPDEVLDRYNDIKRLIITEDK